MKARLRKRALAVQRDTGHLQESRRKPSSVSESRLSPVAFYPVSRLGYITSTSISSLRDACEVVFVMILPAHIVFTQLISYLFDTRSLGGERRV